MPFLFWFLLTSQSSESQMGRACTRIRAYRVKRPREGSELGGQVSWRRVIPAGVATTVCYAGVGLYIQFFVSSNIVSSEASYGPVGVVMTLLTVLVGLGVALHIGAVVGADFGETWRSLRHSTR